MERPSVTVILTIILTVVGVAFAGCMLWIQVDQAKRTQGVDYMSPLLHAAVWAAGLLVILAAVGLNLYDARRSKGKDARIRALESENASVLKRLSESEGRFANVQQSAGTTETRFTKYRKDAEAVSAAMSDRIGTLEQAWREERDKAHEWKQKAEESHSIYRDRPDPSGGLFPPQVEDNTEETGWPEGFWESLNSASSVATEAIEQVRKEAWEKYRASEL